MIFRKRILAVVSAAGLIAASAGMAVAAVTLEDAARAYKEGDYEKAAEVYQTLAGQYPGSAELHYNLGNVYFKLKKTGKALAEYSRAKRIDPRDYDINENLAYAQGLIEYKMEDKRNWYVIQWNRLMEMVTWPEAVFSSLALYSVWIALALVRFALRRNFKLFVLAKPLFILFVLSLGPAVWKHGENTWRREAVVAVPKAEVRYGPSTADKVAFRLVEGLKVRVQQAREDWYLVGLVNGDSGWCEAKNLEVI